MLTRVLHVFNITISCSSTCTCKSSSWFFLLSFNTLLLGDGTYKFSLSFTHQHVNEWIDSGTHSHAEKWHWVAQDGWVDNDDEELCLWFFVLCRLECEMRINKVLCGSRKFCCCFFVFFQENFMLFIVIIIQHCSSWVSLFCFSSVMLHSFYYLYCFLSRLVLFLWW